jgi:hypothetical protein
VKPTTTVTGGNRIYNKLDQFKRRVSENSGVFVGVPAGKSDEESGTPLAVIGAYNEFGTSTIPERSFLRVPLRANQAEFATVFRNQLPLVAQGELTLLQLMEQLGARAVSVSQGAISEGIQPANDPATVRQKGSSTPLVDTGRLRQSITYVVEGE